MSTRNDATKEPARPLPADAPALRNGLRSALLLLATPHSRLSTWGLSPFCRPRAARVAPDDKVAALGAGTGAAALAAAFVHREYV